MFYSLYLYGMVIIYEWVSSYENYSVFGCFVSLPFLHCSMDKHENVSLPNIAPWYMQMDYGLKKGDLSIPVHINRTFLQLHNSLILAYHCLFHDSRRDGINNF